MGAYWDVEKQCKRSLLVELLNKHGWALIRAWALNRDNTVLQYQPCTRTSSDILQSCVLVTLNYNYQAYLNTTNTILQCQPLRLTSSDILQSCDPPEPWHFISLGNAALLLSGISKHSMSANLISWALVSYQSWNSHKTKQYHTFWRLTRQEKHPV